LEVRRGARQCVFGGRHVSFQDGAFEIGATWPSFDAAVRALRRFLEDATSLETLASDPTAENVSRRGPGFMTVGDRPSSLIELSMPAFVLVS
jgi:hypothetical protein